MLETHARFVEHGVPLPTDGRDPATRPTKLMKKVASQGTEHANPFLILAANEALALLEPGAVERAAEKRREKQAHDARWEEKQRIEDAMAMYIQLCGIEKFASHIAFIVRQGIGMGSRDAVPSLLRDMRALVAAYDREKYGSVDRKPKLATPTAANVVSFPAPAG